jgi:hypothetical protein
MSECVNLEVLKKLEQTILKGGDAHKADALKLLKKWKEEQLRGCDQVAQNLLERLFQKHL